MAHLHHRLTDDAELRRFNCVPQKASPSSASAALSVPCPLGPVRHQGKIGFREEVRRELEGIGQ